MRTVASCFIVPVITLIVFVSAVHGLGVSVANPESPGEYDMFFRNMLRGGYAERVVTVSSSGNESLFIYVLVDDSIKNWLSFEPKNFTIAPGTQFSMKVVAQPSADAPNGIYSGLVSLRAAPAATNASSGHTMSIATAVALKTAIEVTGQQIVSYKVGTISVSSTEETLPIDAVVGITNDGNVKVKPKVMIDILNQNKSTVLKSFTFSDTEVLPSVTRRIALSIPSAGLAIGQYWADVKVYSDTELLKQAVLTFDVLEKGSLRITGDLVQVWCPPWVNAGDVVKISAIFANTGQLAASVKFKGEVRLGERLVKILESDELDVPVSGQANLTMYFTPEETGRYVIGGYAVYSKKVTGVKECILNVQGAGSTGMATAGLGFNEIIGGAIVVIIIIAVAVIFKTKLRGGKKA